MRAEARARVDALPAEARVLDVGGWASPLARADAVVDLLPHATRGRYPHEDGQPPDRPERFDASDWLALDACARDPWPFPDDAFDLAVCAHTLEDVRDPVGVCAELSRVARAGYVEVPAPVEELAIGVQGPWVGWSHHRWVCEAAELPPGTWRARPAAAAAPVRDGEPVAGAVPHEHAGGPTRPGLRVTHKPHLLAAPGRHLPAGARERTPPEDRVIALWWTDEFPCEEVVHVEGPTLDAWLAGLLHRHGGPAPEPRAGRRRPWRRDRAR